MFCEKEKELKWKMLLWDIAIAGMALAGAYGLRVLLPGGEREIDPVAHFSVLPVFLMLMILSLSYYGAYLNPINTTSLEIAWSIASGLGIAFAGLVALMFAMKIEFFSRTVLCLFGILLFLGIIFERFYFVWLINRSFQNERNLHKVLIIGTGNRALHLVSSLRRSAEKGLDLIGFLDPYSMRVHAQLPKTDIPGTASDIRGILKHNVVDEVIFAITRSMFEDVQQIVRACEEEGIRIRMMADLYDMRVSRMSLMMVGDQPLLTMEPVAIDESKMVFKSAIDFAFSALFILLLLPVIAIIAVAIKLDSRGPAFFVQERVGFHKRQFRMYKFRSMFDGSDTRIHELEHLNEASGPIFKIENDPRISRVGKFLRQTSLDELPQLFNVLKGEMSLVGPRPMSLRDVARFDRSIQRKRFSVRPGLTCLWQISGRSNLPFSKWLELDLEYIDNWNLFLDLKILFKTIPAVLSGSGAK
jgi:exopolysaccharide biosynthesis polyprenyl glycosylphosphotransferase